MTELEKIAYAKGFIDKLANGINPLSGQPVGENDVVNNVRLSRCFFFVSDVLRQVIDAGGIVPSRKSARAAFEISREKLDEFPFSTSPITVTELTKRLNSLIDPEVMKPLSPRSINEWLMSIGALSEEPVGNGRTGKLPTADGEGLGIRAEERSGKYGNYVAVLYDREAQQFVVDNVEAIAEMKKNK